MTLCYLETGRRWLEDKLPWGLADVTVEVASIRIFLSGALQPPALGVCLLHPFQFYDGGIAVTKVVDNPLQYFMRDGDC